MSSLMLKNKLIHSYPDSMLESAARG